MIDLHLHTNHSDGRLSPGEMVTEAAERGLAAVAITDHDVLSGLPEGDAAAKAAGIELVPGIEMTAGWDNGKSVHLLGYFIDPDDGPLNAALLEARRLMGEHVTNVLAAIQATGADLGVRDLDRYRNRYAGGAALVLGMIERGVLKHAQPGTGWRLLKMAALEPRGYSLTEAVDLIHGAGGVASLAHPAKLKRGSPLLEAEQLRPYVETGIDALEAWQWISNGWGSEHYQALAERFGLALTGGSDDHGKRLNTGAMRLGQQPVPSELLDVLRERAEQVRRRRTSVPG